jgi:hypothetical protein
MTEETEEALTIVKEVEHRVTIRRTRRGKTCDRCQRGISRGDRHVIDTGYGTVGTRVYCVGCAKMIVIVQPTHKSKYKG